MNVGLRISLDSLRLRSGGLTTGGGEGAGVTRGQNMTDIGSNPLLDEADTIPGKKVEGTVVLKTFGNLRFEDHRGRELRAPTRKTAALAAYLAMRPDKRVAREAIAC